MSEYLYDTGSRLAVVPHLSSLVLGLVAIAIVGRPLGWIGFLLPLGPLLSAGVAKAIGRAPAPSWRFALAFSLMCAVLIGGSWLLPACVLSRVGELRAGFDQQIVPGLEGNPS